MGDVMGTCQLMNFDRKHLSYIKKLAAEHGCICKEVWRNNYNPFITYPEQPIMDDIYELDIEIIGKDEFVDFVEYLALKRVDVVNKLESNLELVFPPIVVEDKSKKKVVVKKKKNKKENNGNN